MIKITESNFKSWLFTQYKNFKNTKKGSLNYELVNVTNFHEWFEKKITFDPIFKITFNNIKPKKIVITYFIKCNNCKHFNDLKKKGDPVTKIKYCELLNEPICYSIIQNKDILPCLGYLKEEKNEL